MELNDKPRSDIENAIDMAIYHNITPVSEIGGVKLLLAIRQMTKEILEQVEAGYIPKEEHEEIKWQKEAAEEQINGYWKPNLERAKEAIEQLKANSIPKEEHEKEISELKEEVKNAESIAWDLQQIIDNSIPKDRVREMRAKYIQEAKAAIISGNANNFIKWYAKRDLCNELLNENVE